VSAKTHRLVAVVISSSAALTLAACGSSSDPASASGSSDGSSGKQFSIAATGGLTSDPYWITLECGASKAAKDAGATLDWKGLANSTDSSANAKNVSAQLLAQPDGFLYGVGGTNDAPNVVSINGKGIPVVEVNGTTTPDAENYYQSVASASTASDVAEMGKLIGKNAGGSGSVAVLAGVSGIPPIDARWKPMVEALNAAAPSMEVIDTQYTGFDTAKAATTTSALLTAHPDLKAVFTTSGPEGAGAASAIEAAGKKGKVFVYSFDATPAIVTALKSGTVAALLAQSPYKMGQQGVEALITALESGDASATASPQDVTIPTMILTKDNVDSDAAQDYLYKATC
jgi:ABC-type sugar transport system substrate-binding protein